MYYGEIKKTDIANGPGVRVSLFVSGCTHACRGCFNEQTWDFKFGNPYTEEVEDEIMDALRPKSIRWLARRGWEPMETKTQRSLVKFLEMVRTEYPQKSICCYT